MIKFFKLALLSAILTLGVSNMSFAQDASMNEDITPSVAAPAEEAMPMDEETATPAEEEAQVDEEATDEEDVIAPDEAEEEPAAEE